MKKLSLIAALALGGLLACCTLATAQDTNAPKKGGKRGMMSVEQQMERMTTDLSLTEEQKPKVKAVLEESSKKRQEIFADSSLDRSQMREKMQPINEAQDKKLKEILTSDQYEKYQKMMAERKGGKKKKTE